MDDLATQFLAMCSDTPETELSIEECREFASECAMSFVGGDDIGQEQMLAVDQAVIKALDEISLARTR